MLKRWKPVESIDALGGDGVIAGELSGDPEVPDGLLTVNGVPTSREIEVRERKARRVVSVRRSNTDGTYRFPGLNPALQYDVIARDFAGDYEDVIAGAVRPHTPDLMVPVAAGDKMAAFSDPYGPDVVSLLHFDGPDGSTTFTDQTGKVWTPSGNAQIDTAQSMFGSASGLFDGSGDVLTTPASADFNLFGGDMTIEFFFRPVSTSGNQCLIQLGSSVTNRANVSLVNNITFYTQVPGAGSQKIVATAPSAGVWHHCALVRYGGLFTMYVDGVSVGTSSTSAYPTGSLQGHLGSNNFEAASYYNGHIDELRITKGIARYTANFTPPTAPFEL